MAVNNLGLGLLLEAKDLASGVLGRFSSQLTGVVGQTSAAGKRIQAGMKEAGLGLSIFAAGAMGLAALAPASEAATQFGFQIARVRTVIDETALSTEDARAATLGLAATYGIDALQQADGLYETISAGITDAKQATDLLGVANEFAVGGTTGLAGSVDVLTSAVNTYADTGLTARQASDLMFTAIAAGKTTAEQLSQSLGEVAPTAHAAGVSFAELQATIAALTVQGIKTPQAVTGLNAMLSNMMKPASDATAEAKRLGIQFDAMALKSMGLKGILGQLSGNTKVNEETFTKLFGSIDGVKAALALTAGDGAKFNEVLKQMEGSSGATKKAFEIMADQTQFQENRFAALRKNSLILIGDALEPLKKSVLKTVNTILEGFGKIPAPIRNLLVQGFALVSVVLAVVGGALALKGALTAASAGLSAMGLSGGAVLTSLGPVVGVVGLLALAAYGLKKAYDENIGGFADTVNQAVADVKLAFDALGQLFTSGEFSGDTMLALGKNSGVKEFAIEVFVLGSRLKAFFGAIGDGFTDSLDAVQPALDMLVQSFAPVGKVIGSLFASEGADANASSFTKWALAGERVGGVLATIAGVALTIGSYIGQLVSGATVGLSKMGSTFSGLGTAFKEIYDAIVEVVDALGGAGESGLSLSEIFYALGRGIAGVFGAIVGVVSGVVSGIAGVLRGLAAIVGGVVDIIAGIFSGDWDRVWLGAKKVVFGLVQAVIAALGGTVEAIAGAIDAIASAIGRKTNLTASVKGFRTQLEKDTRDFFGVGPTGASPAPPTAAGAGAAAGANAAAAAAAVAQTERLTAAPQAFATMASTQAVRDMKPPVVSTQVVVQIDGENIPAVSTVRTQVGNGVPVAPAGV